MARRILVGAAATVTLLGGQALADAGAHDPTSGPGWARAGLGLTLAAVVARMAWELQR